MEWRSSGDAAQFEPATSVAAISLLTKEFGARMTCLSDTNSLINAGAAGTAAAGGEGQRGSRGQVVCLMRLVSSAIWL